MKFLNSEFLRNPYCEKSNLDMLKNVQNAIPPHRGRPNKCNGATCKLFSKQITFKIRKKIAKLDVEAQSQRQKKYQSRFHGWWAFSIMYNMSLRPPVGKK